MVSKDKCEKGYIEYKSLTPNDNIENGDAYLEALDWALSQDDIKNIALTGPYGSGKSSVIDTYIKKHKEGREYLKISLATFSEQSRASNNKKQESGRDAVVDEIENSILKQIFYKEKPSKLPKSRYRKLRAGNQFNEFAMLVSAVIALIILGGFFMPEKYIGVWRSLVATYPFVKTSPIYAIVLFFIALVGLLYILKTTVFDKCHISELKIFDAANVQFESSLEETVFNRNLDEIVYFFEKTKYRVVFFEDLDRWNTPAVFVHLRELNNLLNNDNAIKNKPVTFVYAISDDVFAGEERTKFFDFIIPVIPVMNSTNSGEVLKKMLNDARAHNIYHNLSAHFIDDVALYISDMRMMNNVYNEFVLYKKTLCTNQQVELQDEKMFCMMVLKNLYPKDFSNLQKECGEIRQVFIDKENKVDELRMNIDLELKKVLNPNAERREVYRKKMMALENCSLVTFEMFFDGDDLITEAFGDKPFIAFALRAGYIDEQYEDYINYFIGESLTISDKNFLVAVKSGIRKEFDYSLKKMEELISYLSVGEFGKKQIFNFDLLNYLLKEQETTWDSNYNYLERFIYQLSDETEQSWKFIQEFIEVSPNRARFVSLLGETWSNMWNYIMAQESMKYSEKAEWLALIVENLDSEVIVKLNEKGAMKLFIEAHSDILQKLSMVDDAKLSKLLKVLNVSFKHLETAKVSNVVLESVFAECLYEINDEMLKNVIEFKQPKLITNFIQQPYSVIKQCGYEPLKTYIKRNIIMFIHNIMLCKDNLNDQIDDIIEVLGSIVGDVSLIRKLIEKEEFQIDDINKCCDDSNASVWKANVWPILFELDKVIPTWKNIFSYWESRQFDDIVYNFLTDNVAELKDKSTAGLTESFVVSFLQRGFSKEIYEQCVPIMLTISDSQLQAIWSSLTDDVLTIMIKCHYFEFTKYYYEMLQSRNRELLHEYIICNQEAYVGILDNLPSIEPNDFEEFLLNRRVYKFTKEAMLKHFGARYSTSNIAKIVLDEKLKTTKEVFWRLWSVLSEKKEKERLMLFCKTLLDADELERCFKDLGGKYELFTKRDKRHLVRLDLTLESKSLMQYLEEIGYITSYKEEPATKTKDESISGWIKPLKQEE